MAIRPYGEGGVKELMYAPSRAKRRRLGFLYTSKVCTGFKQQLLHYN